MSDCIELYLPKIRAKILHIESAHTQAQFIFARPTKIKQYQGANFQISKVLQNKLCFLTWIGRSNLSRWLTDADLLHLCQWCIIVSSLTCQCPFLHPSLLGCSQPREIALFTGTQNLPGQLGLALLFDADLHAPVKNQSM